MSAIWATGKRAAALMALLLAAVLGTAGPASAFVADSPLLQAAALSQHDAIEPVGEVAFDPAGERSDDGAGDDSDEAQVEGAAPSFTYRASTRIGLPRAEVAAPGRSARPYSARAPPAA